MFSDNPLTQRGFGVLAGLLMLTTATACGSDPEPEPQVPVPAPMPAPVPVPPPAPSVQTGPCDATMQVALQTAIEAREKAELGYGMKKEANAFGCQNVAEGGTLTVAISLQPGKCYTILANSFPNVSEVDMFLKPNLGDTPNPLLASFAGMVLAQDSETGPIASIGSGKSCYKNALPIPGAGKIEVKARTGAGPVAVQVYSK